MLTIFFIIILCMRLVEAFKADDVSATEITEQQPINDKTEGKMSFIVN